MRRPFRPYVPLLLLLAASCSTSVGRIIGRPDFDPGARLLDLPGLPRGDSAYDCGPEALCAVMAFWGNPVDVTLVADRLRPGDQPGTLSSALLEEAQRRGFDATPISGSLGSLRAAVDRREPPILMVRVSPDRYHYFVAVGYSRRERVIACLDYDRSLRLIGYEELERIWGPTDHSMVLILPGSARTHLNLGAAAERVGRWAEAEHHYAKAIETDGQLLEARIGLGNARRGLGDLPGARAHYEKALRHAPGHALAMNNLADVLLALGEEKERAVKLASQAVAAYRHVVERRADRAANIRLAFALGTLGEAQMALDRPREALLSWKASLDLLPEDLVDARARRKRDLIRARRALPDR